MRHCKAHNTFAGKLFALLFKTDHADSIDYIRHHGDEAYAEKMAWDETMAIKRR